MFFPHHSKPAACTLPCHQGLGNPTALAGLAPKAAGARKNIHHISSSPSTVLNFKDVVWNGEH